MKRISGSKPSSGMSSSGEITPSNTPLSAEQQQHHLTTQSGSIGGDNSSTAVDSTIEKGTGRGTMDPQYVHAPSDSFSFTLTEPRSGGPSELSSRSISLNSSGINTDNLSGGQTTTGSSSRQNGRSKHGSFQPSVRHKNSLEELTINKLDFNSLAAKNGLYGRDVEVKALGDAFNKCTKSRKRQLVMLSGYSGVGKTCLARTLEDRVKSVDGLYAEGKFDQQQYMLHSHKPYMAWASACGFMCAKILARENKDAIGMMVEAKLASELPGLLRVFPALAEILVGNVVNTPGGEESKGLSGTPDGYSKGDKQMQEGTSAQNPSEAKAGLSFGFSKLIRTLSEALKNAPIVMVLDDLQWADASSLELLESLMSDRQQDEIQLMIVGIYRSNEVDDSHILSSSLRDLTKLSESSESTRSLLDMTILPVGNLALEAIEKFLSDLLSTDVTKVLDLAMLCKKKTQGNVFFLIHFLKHLYSEGLFQYNFGSMSWNWNENEIEEKTFASDNVVDLLLKKMKGELQERDSIVLQLAASTGSTFRRKYLALLWRQWTTENTPKSFERGEEQAVDFNYDEDLDDILSNVVFEGYIFTSERIEDGYSFVHDKIQEAALCLTPRDKVSSFRRWVGQTLLHKLNPSELASILFVVVNLMNEGTMPDDKTQRMQLATLNSQAANTAMALSAFDSASRYVTMGLSLLGNYAFLKAHYELTLELYSIGASAESCLGNVIKMEKYCTIVESQREVSKEDLLRLKTTWLESLANRGMYIQAIEETLELLAHFNIRFPRNRTIRSIATLMNITKVSKEIKRGVLDKIVDLPQDRDPTRARLLHLMDRLSVYLFYLHDDLMPLVMLRTFQWTVKYGLNDVTPASLTTLGIIFAGVLGDLQTGSKCAQTALDLIPKVSPWMKGRTMFVAHGFGVVWTEPLHSQIKPLQRAYESGLSAGDAESACWAIMLFCHSRFLVSFSLDLVIADVEVYMAQMKDLNQIVAYRLMLANYQMFMNLAGRTNSDPLSLVGDFCVAKDHMQWMKEDAFYSGLASLWECCVHTWYGRHEECAMLVLKYGTYTTQTSNPGTFSVAAFEVISKGVSCMVAARTASSTSQRRKYRQKALEIRRRVKKWIEQGCPNFAHLDAFLDAENSALNKKHFRAVKQYQAAIIVAARGGLLMDAGIFSETFARYLLWKGSDPNEATFRFKEAIKYYEGFGAKRKISMLEEEFSKLLIPASPQDLHTIQILKT